MSTVTPSIFRRTSLVRMIFVVGNRKDQNTLTSRRLFLTEMTVVCQHWKNQNQLPTPCRGMAFTIKEEAKTTYFTRKFVSARQTTTFPMKISAIMNTMATVIVRKSVTTRERTMTRGTMTRRN